MIRTHPALLLAVVLSLLLAACNDAGDSVGISDGPSQADTTTAEEPGSDAADAFTDVDVTFLQGMIPHHAQAVEMAELVADRTAHPDELNALAEEIIAAQEDEIDEMNALLEAAGDEPVDAAMGGMNHSDMGSGEMAMSGMMSGEDMTALAEADGDTFDGQFLEMMIAHHEGAIEAAQQVLDQSDGSPEVADLAQRIIDAQEAEIAQMQGWQQDWGV